MSNLHHCRTAVSVSEQVAAAGCTLVDVDAA